jgi:hypothetical protein
MCWVYMISASGTGAAIGALDPFFGHVTVLHR